MHTSIFAAIALLVVVVMAGSVEINAAAVDSKAALGSMKQHQVEAGQALDEAIKMMGDSSTPLDTGKLAAAQKRWAEAAKQYREAAAQVVKLSGKTKPQIEAVVQKHKEEVKEVFELFNKDMSKGFELGEKIAAELAE